MPDIHWSLFSTEVGLVALTIGCVILGLLIKDPSRQGRILNRVAMGGIAGLLANLAWRWGDSGTSFGETLSQDGLAFVFKVLFLGSGFLVLFMAEGYSKHIKRGHGEFTLLILFSLVGMLFLASAKDFLLFFVALETLTISLYIMTAYLRDQSASIEAGVKFLVMGALSTAVFLFGLSFIYGTTGTTSFEGVRESLLLEPELPVAFLFGMVLVIASLGFKIASVPFQLWAPDVYEGAPTPVTAFLAIGSKAAGFAGLMRLCDSAFQPAGEVLSLVFSILAAATIIYGNLGAIPQRNIKRLMGYSSIGHAGYLLIGLAAFSRTGSEAVLYYLLGYFFATGGAFLVIVFLSDYTKRYEIKELAGLSEKSPLLAAGMFLALLSLAGIPPLAGFFGKFYLFLAAVEAGLLWLVFIGVLNVIASLYYYLKVVKAMYMDSGNALPSKLTVPLSQKIAQWGAILGILALGIYQGPFVEFVRSALRNF